MAQKTKGDAASATKSDPALRQEIADALGLPPDDPKVDQVLADQAGSDVIKSMREAAARGLDAATAPQPADPAATSPPAGPATVIPADPKDNPFTGLTMDQILQRPWKWSEKSPDAVNTTVDHEYIPNPNAPIGTKIEITTTEVAGFKHVNTTVNTPGQPGVLYQQHYTDGELTSSSKQSTDNFTSTPVTDAGGRPAAPNVREGLDHSTPTASPDGADPAGGTPGDTGSPEPTRHGGAYTNRGFSDGPFFYEEHDNGDGTSTWTRYDSRDHTTSTATVGGGLITNASDAAGLDYGGDKGDTRPMQDGADDPDAGSFGDEAGGGGGDDTGDPSPAQDGADDPDAGSFGDEVSGGGGDDTGDPSPAQDGADDPDAGSSGDEGGGGGDETGDPAGADGQGGGGGDDDTSYLVDDGYSSAGPALEVDHDAPPPPSYGGERSVASGSGGGHRNVESGQNVVYAIPEGTDLSALEARLARLGGDHGDPNDPNDPAVAATLDWTQRPGDGVTDPTGEPEAQTSGPIGFGHAGGDYGNPFDPNAPPPPSSDDVHPTTGPDPTTELTAGSAAHVAASSEPAAGGQHSPLPGATAAPAPEAVGGPTPDGSAAVIAPDDGGPDAPATIAAPEVGAGDAGSAPAIAADGPGDFSAPPPGAESTDAGGAFAGDPDDPDDGP